MSRLNTALSEFREFKNRPSVKSNLSTTLNGVKKKVVILVPTTRDPQKRWRITVFLLKLVWSARASGSMVTGAFISLLTIFAEHPAQMIRALSNDPDLEAQIAEIKDAPDDKPLLATRGQNLKAEEDMYQRIAQAGPTGYSDDFPFANSRPQDIEATNTEQLQIGIASITMQIWVLLSKAVTAPDNAPDAEGRRWVKFLQQKRVVKDYQLSSEWLNQARDYISADLSIRRFMVEILLEIRRTSGIKSRIVQMIDDIGNYIQEAGMAGFFLTIKYGIETRYPTLALNEFQSDLNTVLDLMKAYKEFGERAPFMVILEESAQTKFAPGNYTLLWSYAMGVGSALDSSMANLNFTRNYLMMNYFRLGQDTVIKMEGNLDQNMANELGVTSGQVEAVRALLNQEGTTKTPGNMPNKSFVVSDVLFDDEGAEGGASSDEEERAKPPIRRGRERSRSRPPVQPPPRQVITPAMKKQPSAEAKNIFAGKVSKIMAASKNRRQDLEDEGYNESRQNDEDIEQIRPTRSQLVYTNTSKGRTDMDVMNDA
uniref:Nucleocapsid n=1 Tax=Jeilongvirus sp. TaxID=2686070 RepID=A0A8F7GQ59_9MONO|nr:N protein [Jeilongvirus sp.]QXU63478.1 N protein [Jeilongvirus sp.]